MSTRSKSRFPARDAAGILCLLLIPGCFTKPFDPVAPRWDVALTAPISVERYTLARLVEKEPAILSSGSGGELVYHATAAAVPHRLGEIFSLAPLGTTTSARLGPLSVGAIPPLRIPVAIPGAAPGQSLPALDRVSLPAAGVTFSQFVELEILSGTVTLTLQNNLPVPLTIDSAITLRNGSGGVIVSFSFSGNAVPAFGTASASADLTDRTVTSAMAVANFCISTSEGIAQAPTGDLLVATVTSSPITVSRAVLSAIPPQRLVDNDRFALPVRDSSRVREVHIASGRLTLDVTSGIGMSMSMHARFPQLITPQGLVYVDSFFLGPRATLRREIPLAGLRLRSTTGAYVDEVEVVTSVDLFEGSRGLPITVSRSDSVRIEVSSTTLVLDQVVGILKPTPVAIDQKFGLDLGPLARSLEGEILLPAANLVLTPETAFDIPVGVNLTLRARDGQGHIVILPVPVTKTTRLMEPIVFDPADVGLFLSRLSGRLPDTLQLAGTLVLNPDYDTTRVSTIGSGMTVGGAVDLSVPLKLALMDGFLADTVAVGDTTGDGVSDAASGSAFYDRVAMGRIHCEFDNGLPLGAEVSITFCDRDLRPLLTIPQSAGDSVSVPPAFVTGAGVPATTARSSRVIELSGREIQLLKQAVYLRYAMGLRTPGSGPVSFRSIDGIDIRIWSEITYEVEP